jgi:hypothetical protein
MARAEEAKLDPWSSSKTGARIFGLIVAQRELIILDKNVNSPTGSRSKNHFYGTFFGFSEYHQLLTHNKLFTAYNTYT